MQATQNLAGKTYRIAEAAGVYGSGRFAPLWTLTGPRGAMYVVAPTVTEGVFMPYNLGRNGNGFYHAFGGRYLKIVDDRFVII